MTAPAPPRRRWFRYNLRTFFVVLTIFGVWLGVQVKWIHDRQEAQQWIESQGGGFATEGGRFRSVRPEGMIVEGEKISLFDHAKAPWSIRLIGARTVYWVDVPRNGDAQFEDAEMRELKRLFPEADVH